jgi:type IV pilus assembly protein PilO
MEVSPEVQAKIDQLAKLPRAARAGIIGACCALIVAGYYFGVYQDSKLQLDRLRAQELELQRKLSEVRSVAANIAAFEEEITELEAKLSKALRQLPNEKQLEVLLTDISNLAKSSGVEIKSFKRNDEIVHDFYAEVPIALSLEGGYHDIAHFFDMVSRLPRIVNMGSLNMSVGEESEDSTRLRVTGTATTFRFVGQKA